MKQGQVFTLDFILGLVGFIFLLLLAIKVLISIVPVADYQDLYRDNVYVSEQLVGSGFPPNWSTTAVIVPGLTSQHQLNLTKLADFDALNYSRTKTLFHIGTEYVFFFRNNTAILNISSCLHGYPLAYNATTCEPDLSSLSYDNLAKTQRLIAYNNSITQLIVYSWS